ncbi:MAG TPA: hypothetical protein VGK62_04765 [Gaiellaceae bacterium]
MLVPDEMRKCVAFLYYRRSGQIKAAGTGFFVGWPTDGENAAMMLVTAHHVIDGIRRHSDDGDVLIRLNTTDGGSTLIAAAIDEWFHPRADLDCAVLFWQPPQEAHIDVRFWLLRTDHAAQFAQEGIGIGDEVFMVGLFRNHLGRDRNEPIIRVGNIAAMPTDPIQTQAYGEMRAVLVEARSIGGLSGSPVFVHLGFSRLREGQIMQWRPSDNTVGPFVLLGLVHGHWDALETQVDLLGDAKINMGVGIVVPIGDVIDAIRPTMEEAMRLATEEQAKRNAPTEDVAEDEFDRFEELARQVVNTPKQKPDEDAS